MASAGRGKSKVVAGVLFGALLSGCAGTGAPSGWLPTAEATQEEAHGAWIRVQRESGRSDVEVAEGEFIAVHEETLFVLVADGLEGDLVAVPRTPDLKVKLGTYNPESGGIAAWTLLGSLSTVSHGFNLLLTLPTWIITGTVVANNAGREAIEYHPGNYALSSLDTLRVYARFP